MGPTLGKRHRIQDRRHRLGNCQRLDHRTLLRPPPASAPHSRARQLQLNHSRETGASDGLSCARARVSQMAAGRHWLTSFGAVNACQGEWREACGASGTGLADAIGHPGQGSNLARAMAEGR